MRHVQSAPPQPSSQGVSEQHSLTPSHFVRVLSVFAYDGEVRVMRIAVHAGNTTARGRATVWLRGSRPEVRGRWRKGTPIWGGGIRCVDVPGATQTERYAVMLMVAGQVGR